MLNFAKTVLVLMATKKTKIQGVNLCIRQRMIFFCLKQCLSSAFLGFYDLRVWKILFLVLLFDTFLFLSKTSIYSFFSSCDWVRIEKLVEKY